MDFTFTNTINVEMPDADVAAACIRFEVPITVKVNRDSGINQETLRIEIDQHDLDTRILNVTDLRGESYAAAVLLYASAQPYNGNYDGMWNFGVVDGHDIIPKYVAAVKEAYPGLIVKS